MKNYIHYDPNTDLFGFDYLDPGFLLVEEREEYLRQRKAWEENDVEVLNELFDSAKSLPKNSNKLLEDYVHEYIMATTNEERNMILSAACKNLKFNESDQESFLARCDLEYDLMLMS